MRNELGYLLLVYGLPTAVGAVFGLAAVTLFPNPSPTGGMATEAGGLLFAAGVLLAVGLAFYFHEKAKRW